VAVFACFTSKKICGETKTRFRVEVCFNRKGKSREPKRWLTLVHGLDFKTEEEKLEAFHSANQAGTLIGPSHI